MTARERVIRARRALGLIALARIAVLAAAGTLLTLAMLVLVDRITGLPRDLRALAVPAAMGLGIVLAARTAWHLRAVGSLERVALWLEERLPTDWALPTALDPRFAGLPGLARAGLGPHDGELLRDTAARALAAPLGVLLMSGVLLGALPGASVARITRPRPGDVLAGPPRAALAAYVVVVQPPGYTGLAPDTADTPLIVRGVEGSTILIEGRGEGVLCGLTRGRCRIERTPVGWRARLLMPDSGTVVTLNADTATRLLALVPRRDSLPVVLLRLPERDTVLRVAGGSMPLAADLHDDFGVVEARFEYVVSSGFGESYTFREGTIEGRQGGRTAARQGLEAVLDLDALGLGPGDVAHVRAVARDAGPERRGWGVSSTRAIRIARAGEYDSIATVALPALPSDSSALSQRLLIQLTEALLARLPRLEREVVVEESRAIGRDQARLRRVVADVIFMRLGGEPAGEHAHDEDEGEGEALTPEELLAAAEAASAEAVSGEALDFHGDETPVVAVNRPLLEAYNAMWDAARELNVGAPRAALPHMYRALEAIQRARQAERIYLRGRPRVPVLDLDAVRLAGDREEARPAPRSGSEEMAPARRLLDRFTRAIGRTDSLLLLRVELLDTRPDAAAALGDAIDAMRRGGDPAPALARARAAIAGPATAGSGRWGAW